MRLIFDARFIRVDHPDGISRFSSELFSAVSKLLDVTALICDERQLQKLPAGVDFILANNPTSGLAEFLLPFKLNRTGATHVFSPMQTMGSFGRKYKLALTLHDLIYYSHPKAPSNLSLLVRVIWRIYHLSYLPARLLLNRADVVVTVSHTSKSLIQDNRLTNKPIHVVYNAATNVHAPNQTRSKKSRSGRETLLYMGSFMEYKNVECLIQAMKSLPDFQLVLLSEVPAKRQADLLELAGEARTQLIFANGVTDDHYSNLLEEAFALVTASRAEGFGIPLVEAMHHSIPLVVSDIPIFHEVADQAALYFDPTDPAEFVNQVLKLSQDEQWRAFSQASAARATSFNWNNSATALLQALSST